MANWFKFIPSKFIDDYNIMSMPESVQIAWVKLLCLTSMTSPQSGVIGMSDAEICWWLRLDTKAWAQAKAIFVNKLLITLRDEQGINFAIDHWEQHKPPVSRDYSYRQHQKFVFERDEYKCIYCGATEDLSLDHVIPQSRGGSDEPDNLACCGLTCNSSKGDRTPDEWRGPTK